MRGDVVMKRAEKKEPEFISCFPDERMAALSFILPEGQRLEPGCYEATVGEVVVSKSGGVSIRVTDVKRSSS